MARILLVRTSTETSTSPYGAPPIGLMYLTTALKKKDSHTIKVVDMQSDLLKPEDIVREFKELDADIVGLSTFTLEAGNMRRVAKAIKEIDPKCPIVVGGPHVSSCQSDLLEDHNIDFGVVGEGELTFPELVDSLSAKEKDFSRIKGIIYREDGQIKKTPSREYIDNLDEVGFPTWDIVDFKKYYALPRFMRFDPKDRSPYMPLVTSRGCPYQCVYCHVIQGKLFRARSAEHVFSEIKYLYDTYGVDDFEVFDDIFNLDKDRATKICNMIMESGIKIRLAFPNGLRGDLLNKDVLRSLYQAGTRLISFAPETGSPRIHKMIKKNVKMEKLSQNISDAVDVGIHAHGFFMIGFPTETKEDIKQTFNYIAKSRLTTADFFIVNPFPGTELYNMIKAMGKPVPGTFDNIDFHNTKYNVSEIDTKELLSYQMKLFMRFYFDIRRILRIFRSPLLKKSRFLFYVQIFVNRVFRRKRY